MTTNSPKRKPSKGYACGQTRLQTDHNDHKCWRLDKTPIRYGDRKIDFAKNRS